MDFSSNKKRNFMPSTPQPGVTVSEMPELFEEQTHLEHVHELVVEQWREDRVIHHFEKKEI